MMVAVPEKPTSEQIRLEAEKLRDTAVKLMSTPRLSLQGRLNWRSKYHA
jgi:hypothetical protein